MSRGFRLFRVSGVSVNLDFSWFIFFFLVVWTYGRFYFPAHDVRFTTSANWVLAVIAALLLFASIIFHELSHAIVSNRLGFPIRRITLFIFGGVAHMHNEPNDPKVEFKVAAAGPLSSLLLWLIFSGLAIAAELQNQEAFFAVCVAVASLNWALALFNLVPGFPLDGGRLLRATIWWKTGSLKKATNVAARIGEGFAYLVMIAGVVLLFRESWIAGFWYILIGVFLRNAAEQSYQHVLLEEVLEGIHVEAIMGREVMSVSEDEQLESVEEKFLHHKFPIYPVLDRDGRVIGIIDVQHVKNVSRQERETLAVTEVMQPLKSSVLPRPETLAVEALRQMVALGLGRLPVVDQEGGLAGIVTQRDIMNVFQIRTDLAEESR